MAFGVQNAANSSLTELERYQRDLQTNVGQAASGKRITSAAIDPSGLAIATNLTTQSQAFDAATQNAQNAQNAANVAEGALQTTTDILQRVNTLAIQATNDFLSPTQRASLQGEADQLVKQVNTVAENATFNGVNLLTGQFSGTTPAQAATATVTSNASLAGGGNLANTVSAAASATAGTVTLSVQQGASGTPAQVQATFTNTATGQSTNLGTFASGATINANGTSITVGNVGNADANQTATVQVAGATAGAQNGTLTVQTGSNEGQTTGFTLPNGGSAANFLQNIDLSSSQSATNAQGQISQALSSVTSARANLGAEIVSSQEAQNANNVASTALTASATGIAGDNAAQRSTELNALLVKNTLSLETLKNANTEAGYLNRFFNTSQ